MKKTDTTIGQKLLLRSLKKINLVNNSNLGINSISEALKTPYYYYIDTITNSLKRENSVLEIGSGIGEFTDTLLKTKSIVYSTDISFFSLLLLKERFKKFDNLKISVAEIEKLPFTNNKFDFVVSSGTLSYGDNKKVMLEIHRVLKKMVFLFV